MLSVCWMSLNLVVDGRSCGEGEMSALARFRGVKPFKQCRVRKRFPNEIGELDARVSKERRPVVEPPGLGLENRPMGHLGWDWSVASSSCALRSRAMTSRRALFFLISRVSIGFLISASERPAVQ